MKISTKLICLFFAFASFSVEAGWVCESSSGYRSGNSLYVCGQGNHFDESRARISALEAAYNEFRAICSKSYDCRNHEIKTTQYRTDCQENNGKFRCLRMIEFEILRTMKEADSEDYQPDFNEGKEDKIDWKHATAADLTNYSLTLGYQGQTASLKDYKNLTGSGLYLGFSKRLSRYLGLSLAGAAGRAETSGMSPTTLDYTGYSIGTPFFISWDKHEVSLVPSYYHLESTIEKDNQKTPSQRQTGYGLEIGYTRLFYFTEKDRWYLGLSPRAGIVSYGDSKDLKAQSLTFFGILALTVGFR